MPFQSEKQRRYLWANEPEIARDWADTYGSRIEKNDGGISQLVKSGPGRPGYKGRPHGGFDSMGGNGDSSADRGGEQHRQKAMTDVAIGLERARKSTPQEEGFRKYSINPYRSRPTTTTPRDGGGGQYLDNRYLNYLASQKSTEDEEEEDTLSAFQKSLTGTAETPDYYVGETPLASNLEWGKKMGVDPRTMGLTSFAAEGGRIPRAFGGIMDSSTGRRGYFLGSIGKALGSVAKAAKKVLKSPIGKAAVMYGLGAMGGSYGLGKGLFSKGMFNPMNMKAGLFGASNAMKGMRNKAAIEGLFGKLGLTQGYGGLMPSAKGWIGAATMLPWLMPGPEEDDEGDKGSNYDLLRDKYAQELMNIKAGVSAGSLNPNQWSYLPADYVYKGAEGGRSGFYAGGQSTPSDYTIEDAMMTTTQDKLGGITEAMKRADLYRKGDVGQFYAAQGGRIGYKGGGTWGIDTAKEEWNKLGSNSKLGYVDFVDFFLNGPWGSNQYRTGSDKLAEGGRIGYDAGGQTGHPPITIGQVSQAPPQAPVPQAPPMPAPQPNPMAMMNPMARGMNPMGGGTPRVMAQEGGLMDLGGMEKDYRNDGGFVPLGGEEKADDVPARLSRNEFVFTADAVRGAGGGDIDKGAEIMENVMKNLEEGGQISEETQGLSGAQGMFDVSERLSEVV